MRDELFSGFSETGWDAAPWDVEPTFTAEELQILLNPALTPAEAAYRVGCVVHDVIRLRRTARKQPRRRTEAGPPRWIESGVVLAAPSCTGLPLSTVRDLSGLMDGMGDQRRLC